MSFICFLFTAAHVSFDSVIYIFNLPAFFPYLIHFLILSCTIFMVFGSYFIDTTSFCILWNMLSGILKCSFDFCREIIFIIFKLIFPYLEIFFLRPVFCLFLFLYLWIRRTMFRVVLNLPSFTVSTYTCLGLLLFLFVFTWRHFELPRFTIRYILGLKCSWPSCGASRFLPRVALGDWKKIVGLSWSFIAWLLRLRR